MARRTGNRRASGDGTATGRGTVFGAWIAAASALAVLAVGCASTPPTAKPRGSEPYTVKGRTYYPEPEPQIYQEEGVASWYGDYHHGRRTANGERFDAYHGLTAAHKTLPFDTCVRVEMVESGRAVTVRINDRGPFAKGRVIDLSRAAAEQIGLVDAGVAPVHVSTVGTADEQGRCSGT
jgi:peptidoglycan lytic transglycosylase